LGLNVANFGVDEMDQNLIYYRQEGMMMKKIWALVDEYWFMTFLTVYFAYETKYQNLPRDGWFKFTFWVLVIYWAVVFLNFVIMIPLKWTQRRLHLEIAYLQKQKDELNDRKHRTTTISVKIGKNS
jgi:hypothetical protein